MATEVLLKKAHKVIGHTLAFRNVSEGDAEFILTLRTDIDKSKYLSTTNPDIHAQRTWLRNYQQDEKQAYFIIESLTGESLGTVRLYDPKGASFCWGSWILKSGRPSGAAIESALMVYSYALDQLGFMASHFDVRRENERVWQFHERMGATRVIETESDYFYGIGHDAIRASMQRYHRYLPSPVTVEWLNPCAPYLSTQTEPAHRID
jgi:RimJ/RimL family protein N-acetyltransferase